MTEMNNVNHGAPEMGQSRATTDDEIMVGWMGQVLTCTIRGILAVFPQYRVEKTLIIAVGVFANTLAQTYGGEEFSVRRFRKMCSDQFDGVLKAAPLVKIERDTKADTASVEVKGG